MGQENGAGSMNKHGYTLVGQSVLTERQRQTAKDLGYELPEELSGKGANGHNRDDKKNVTAEVAVGDGSRKNNSKALKKQLAMLEEDPDLTYCLFTPSNE